MNEYSPVPLEEVRTQNSLSKVTDNIKDIIEKSGVNLESKIRGMELRVIPVDAFDQLDQFYFSGQIYPAGKPAYPEIGDTPTAAIRTLWLPQNLRGKGIGIQIVSAWESTIKELGITTFMALSIYDRRAEIFWERCGYKKIPEVTEAVMYKTDAA